eukprot:3654531-Lingulodinium_polyedra.AAC.1
MPTRGRRGCVRAGCAAGRRRSIDAREPDSSRLSPRAVRPAQTSSTARAACVCGEQAVPRRRCIGRWRLPCLLNKVKSCNTVFGRSSHTAGKKRSAFSALS